MASRLLILLALLSVPVESRSVNSGDNYNAFYTSRILDDVFYGRKVPDFCFDFFNSSSAKLKIGNIDRDALKQALEREEAEEDQKLRSSVDYFAQQQYSDHICDAEEFAPSVLSASHEMTCFEICRQCVPGSVPICFLRNPQYTALGQVCLCSYDLQDPVENAAFSLRHEKRIFNRRIRSQSTRQG